MGSNLLGASLQIILEKKQCPNHAYFKTVLLVFKHYGFSPLLFLRLFLIDQYQ